MAKNNQLQIVQLQVNYLVKQISPVLNQLEGILMSDDLSYFEKAAAHSLYNRLAEVEKLLLTKE